MNKYYLSQLQERVDTLQMNDIARVLCAQRSRCFSTPIAATGSLILVDESTNETVAAGMIV